jgi:hypothetical protein
MDQYNVNGTLAWPLIDERRGVWEEHAILALVRALCVHAQDTPGLSAFS